MEVQTEDIPKSIAGLRVLVVDDVTDCRDLVELYLMQIDAEVRAVASAKDAMESIEKFRPELIITDVYMPEKDGFWLIEQLNKLNTRSQTKIPAIALTAAAEEKDRERLIIAGYDGYLAKPFIFENLTELIVKLTAKSK